MKVEGLADLEKALDELPAAAGKNVLRRIGRKALKPFLDRVVSMAPVDDPSSTPKRPAGTYRASWRIGTQLNRNQKRQVKAEGKSNIEVYAGTNDRVGHLLEFGTGPRISGNRDSGSVPAQPHATPAWDATGVDALMIVKNDLGEEIEKTANRLAKKRMRG